LRLSQQVKTLISCFLVTLGAVALEAQSFYPRHNFTLGVGGAQPRGELNGAFSNSAGVNFAYGYRFQKYFQADAGFDTVFGAGGTKAYEENAFGYSRIRDYQFFVPVGGRAILPLFRGRLLFAGGAGAAYLRYSELLHQPSEYIKVDCISCTARDGWGYYALLDLSYFLDRGQHFRIGAVTKVFRGHTEGEPLGALPGVRTRDRWINTFGQFGFSF
jgi:hypothetical protein